MNEVCGMLSGQKVSMSWNKTLRQKIMNARDLPERLGVASEQDAALDTTVERLYEVVWCLKVGDIGPLHPENVENQLLIFDHNHNTLYVCPKDEATLESMAKFLKEENLIA
jgi:hypothetical protein